MLFGEWCYARHTIVYDALLDWFLVFDVFEPATGVFWSGDRRNALAEEIGLRPVPRVFCGLVTLKEVPSLIGSSALGGPSMEGIYLRRESEGHLMARAKVVSPEFHQLVEEHWSRRQLIANKLSVAEVAC